MGMFDSVRCEYPLPDPSRQGIEFQTKSLLLMMDHYTITSDGRLVQDIWRDGRHVPDREWLFHGDVVMHGTVGPKEGVEYLVRFTHGRVEWIHRLAEPADGQEALQRETEVDDRFLEPVLVGLMPGVHGRLLTADEFMTYAPSKLELIDGNIPGGEGLLRLLLMNQGLRRAALMVGRRVWGQVWEGTSRDPKTEQAGQPLNTEEPTGGAVEPREDATKANGQK